MRSYNSSSRYASNSILKLHLWYKSSQLFCIIEIFTPFCSLSDRASTCYVYQRFQRYNKTCLPYIHIAQNSIQLKILEAYTRDVGRGVTRIDYESMDALGASTGDILEITGKRRSVARCLPLYPSDEGKGIIRVDGLGRNNTGIGIGDTVTVRKIKTVPAEKVIVAPLDSIPPIDERYLTDSLENIPLVKGDNIMVPYFGGRLTFQVIGITPATDAVLVTPKTEFHIAEKGESLRGVPQVSYEDIGGMSDEIRKVREMIELPMRHPEIFEKLGVEAPKGVLLYGVPGTGNAAPCGSVVPRPSPGRAFVRSVLNACSRTSHPGRWLIPGSDLSQMRVPWRPNRLPSPGLQFRCNLATSTRSGTNVMPSDYPLPLRDPESLGFAKKPLEHLDRLIRQHIDEGRYPGAQIALARHGQLALFRSYGNARLEPEKVPATDDTLFLIFSQTKVLTSATVWSLVEEGKLSFMDKVADHIPAFAARGKGDITLEQVMTHQGGFPGSTVTKASWADHARMRRRSATSRSWMRRTGSASSIPAWILTPGNGP